MSSFVVSRCVFTSTGTVVYVTYASRLCIADVLSLLGGCLDYTTVFCSDNCCYMYVCLA